MRLFDRLLVAIVSVGVAGVVQARGVDFMCGAGGRTAAIAVKGSDASSTASGSTSQSLIDILNALIGADHRTVAAPATRDPVGTTPVQLTRVADSARPVQPGDASTRPPTAAEHEPPGWTVLLCALVVVAFIARRKVNWAAG